MSKQSEKISRKEDKDSDGQTSFGTTSESSLEKIFEKEELEKLFEERYLKGTCFSSLKELQEDKTLVDVNAPRALIAIELIGIWRGLNDNQLKQQILQKFQEERQKTIEMFENKIKPHNISFLIEEATTCINKHHYKHELCRINLEKIIIVLKELQHLKRKVEKK